MKSILAVTLLALAFTTGFTCSKQTPETPPPAEMPAPTQDTMGAPAETAPVEGTMPAPTEAAPADANQ